MPDRSHPPLSAPHPGRRTVRSRRITLALLATTIAAAIAPSPAVAATDQQVAEARDMAAGWLADRQQADGSLGSSRGLDAAWALLGLAGNGTHGADLRPAGNPLAPSAQDHYAGLWGSGDDAAWSSSGTPQATDYARTTLIATAAGIDPTRIAPTQNLTAKLAGFWRDGYFQSRTNLLNQTILGLLALQQVGAVPSGMIEQLARNVEAAQHVGGGYSIATAETPPTVPGGPSPLASPSNDLDFTGAAIAALCGAGRTTADPSVADAITFLKSKRLASGALGSTIGNVNSNAWALQGLGACGVRRGTAAWAAGGFESTVDWLLATQRPDGAWAIYPEMAGSPSADAYATQDALRALLDRTGFAVEPPARADAADPVWRPTADVPAGTSISVALTIDTGYADERRFCEVPTVQGATLRELLQAARSAATPAQCVLSPRWDGGELSVLNGRRTATASGGWRWSVDGGGTASAAGDGTPVSAGQVVSLRLVEPAAELVPPDPGDPDPKPPAPEPPVDPDPPVDPPYLPPPAPPYVPPFVPAPPQQPTKPTAPVSRVTARSACRRTSRNRAVRCTVRARGRFTVTTTVPGRKAVRRTARTRVVTVVRSSRALRSTQRVRLRIAVGQRARTITVRADGRTTTSRI